MQSRHPISLIYSTYPSHEAAAAVAETLLEERLVACCNILPAGESLYRWEGTLTRTAEVAMLCKVTQSAAPRAAARIGQLHPYDCPAILTFTVEANAPFAQWVGAASAALSLPR